MDQFATKAGEAVYNFLISIKAHSLTTNFDYKFVGYLALGFFAFVIFSVLWGIMGSNADKKVFRKK